MAPRSALSSGSFNFQRESKHHAPIPRRLVRIVPDQQKLLDRADAWAVSLKDERHANLNVPPEVLESLRCFHASKVPPPAGQKPPTSSTSAPANTTEDATCRSKDKKQDRRDGEKDEVSSSSEEEIEVSSWSSSPSRARSSPGLAEANETRDDASPSKPPKTVLSDDPPPPNSSDSRSSPSGEPSHKRKIGQRTQQPVEFLTQAPISSVTNESQDNVATDRSATSLGSRTQSSGERHPVAQQLFSVSKNAPISIPPSSAEEDELEMEIPGALTHATPPINRLAAMTEATPGVTYTPPCGQGSVIPSTYTDTKRSPRKTMRPAVGNEKGHDKEDVPARKHPRKRMKEINFSDGDGLGRDDTKLKQPGALQTPGSPSARSANPKSVTTPPERVALVSQTMSASLGPVIQASPRVSEEDMREGPSPPPPPPGQEVNKVNGRDRTLARTLLPVPESKASEAIVAKQAKSIDYLHDGITDLADRFWHQPYETFHEAYPSFNGSLGDFVKACLSIRSLRYERKLPGFLYDDFIRVFCGEYIRYIEETVEEEPMYAFEWYVENVSQPAYQRLVVTKENLDRVFTAHSHAFDSARRSLGVSFSSSEEDEQQLAPLEKERLIRSVDRLEQESRSQEGLATKQNAANRSSPDSRVSIQGSRKRPRDGEEEVEASVMSTSNDSWPNAGNTPRETASSQDHYTRQDSLAKRQTGPIPVYDHPTSSGASPACRGSVILSNTTTVEKASLDALHEPVRADEGTRESAHSPHTPHPNSTIATSRSPETRAKEKTKARILPSTFSPGSRSCTTDSAKVDKAPSSTGGSLLTQESGVKKLKKKNMSKTERYKLFLAKGIAQGKYLSRVGSSSAPQS